jgi:hypothetical protein
MNARRALILPLLFVTVISFLGVSTPAQAARVHTSIGIRVAIPPPPLRHEVVIARPGPHYVWVGGYWDWRPARRDYVWVPGHWMRPPRAHSVWVAPHYVQRNHHHYYRRGYWRH